MALARLHKNWWLVPVLVSLALGISGVRHTSVWSQWEYQLQVIKDMCCFSSALCFLVSFSSVKLTLV